MFWGKNYMNSDIIIIWFHPFWGSLTIKTFVNPFRKR